MDWLYRLTRFIIIFDERSTSTSLWCEMQPVKPLERPMTREGKVTV
jgi:hypothetical protein